MDEMEVEPYVPVVHVQNYYYNAFRLGAGDETLAFYKTLFLPRKVNLN